MRDSTLTSVVKLWTKTNIKAIDPMNMDRTLIFGCAMIVAYELKITVDKSKMNGIVFS